MSDEQREAGKAVTLAINKMEEAAFAIGAGSPQPYGTVASRVALYEAIAAAIAAARAEGEKAGRDAGVAIGAANMRERCASRIDELHAPFSYAEIASFMRSTPLPTDATAILAAERAAGRAEMRRACVTLVRQTNMVDSDPESLSDEIRALVLP